MSRISNHESYKNYRGEIEIIVKDRNGRVVRTIRENNLIKVFGKELLAHGLPYTKVWNPTADSGAGAWESRTEELYDDYAPKYILFGASYDVDGNPLGKADTRYYTYDVTTSTYTPVTPEVGADNDGDLINPIPISEPTRPLKKIETVSFSSSYQPADSPLLSSDVRAMNNVVSFETTLRTDEYNGLGATSTDSFTITEIALAAGKELDASIGACECAPHVLFLEGLSGSNSNSMPAIAGGGTSITLDPGGVGTGDINTIKTGDQIMIVSSTVGTESYDTFGQVSPYYLVVDKPVGGLTMTLDRTPTYVDSGGDEVIITGTIGVYRSTLRLFSQRILTEPFTKDSTFEIVVRWSIFFS